MSIAAPNLVSRRLDTPASELGAAVASWDRCCLLESGPGFGEAGRWSILAAEPRLVFEMTGERWSIRGQNLEEAGSSDGLARLAQLLDEFQLARPEDASDPDGRPFTGGMIGTIGYDLAPRLERLPRKAGRDSRIPDIRLGLFDTAIVLDHRDETAELCAFDLMNEGGAALERRLDAWEARLADRARPSGAVTLTRLRSEFTRESYSKAVGRALEYINAGDIFQVNLSQRFIAESEINVDPRAVRERLRSFSPAPYSALIRWGDLAVVSASPELFYKTEGRRIVTRPIKGTRPRGDSPAEDARLAVELRTSPKDRAELTMIIDLERNDLGRVCEYGSVGVVEAMTVESYAQVHHLVATVEGKLRRGVGPVDVIKAVFPGGSITGAPKIRAMEIIDELEPNRRSVYTGAIGYFSRGGRSAWNIAIRTILIEGRRVSFQVGGGIVADSIPELEYAETLHKAEGLRLALEASDDGDS